MKRLINIVLIACIVLSNISMSSVMAKGPESDSVEKNEDSVENYKIYNERKNETIPIYTDNVEKKILYEVKDNTSVLVKNQDLEDSLENNDTYIFVRLNPNEEDIPNELSEQIENVEDIQGFVDIKNLVGLEDEEDFLETRESEASEEDVEKESELIIEEDIKDEITEEDINEEPGLTIEEDNDEQENNSEEELDETNDEKETLTKERSTLSVMRNVPKESNTSLLGHIPAGNNQLIYKTIGGESFKVTAQHKNKVYYIKRQAKVDAEMYYLLSTSPSAEKNVVGWMKAKDLSTQTHESVNRTALSLKIKGTGKATSKAWGGSKDTVHSSLSKYKGEMFHVNLTEKVGKNTWYRGKINNQGSNVWLNSNQTIKESNISRLGHIPAGNNQLMYKTIGGESFKVTAQHKNKVYYIKRQAKVGTETYYLLSTSPSSEKNVVGWMKAKDLSTQTHEGVSRTTLPLKIKGTGKATNKAWGGSKDTVHSSLSKYKGEMFHVNLTEKVGKNTWYRGKINDQGSDVWLNSNQTSEISIKESNISRLGHIPAGNNQLMYKTIGGESFKVTAEHKNKVYYIKRQAKVDAETYYLLSTSPSAEKNVVGWMKAKDLSTQTHGGVNRTALSLKIKGTGKATSKAWGGSKDTVHSSLSKYKGEMFHVNLTEKVGKNTWYRGKINNQGSNVWLNSNQTIKESNISRLGHIPAGNNQLMYKTIGGESFKVTAEHKNKVYYIKRQAKVDAETYYLLSTSPSAEKNVVGWMKAKDLSTQTHEGVNRTALSLKIKGTGKATSKAWGGSKDTIYASMSGFKDKTFNVNLTEKVGKNTWYRGKIDGKGKNLWLRSNQTQNRLIVLDAGHGGHDGGASANGIIEKDVVLDVTLRVEKILKARGYKVLLTRKTDKFIDLSERSNIANNNNASTFLSIHANSGGGIGTETWWYNQNNAVSSKLFAQNIQNAVINKTKARDRGIKNGNLSINRESKMVSALLEIGFVDSLTDARNLKKASYKNKIAVGVADGFDNYYK